MLFVLLYLLGCLVTHYCRLFGIRRGWVELEFYRNGEMMSSHLLCCIAWPVWWLNTLRHLVVVLLDPAIKAVDHQALAAHQQRQQQSGTPAHRAPLPIPAWGGDEGGFHEPDYPETGGEARRQDHPGAGA